ncbi:TetR/AcrR family transcriptional regulator [Nocardioides sp. GY 10127]|uniref:TetR/AcrR family transcriptional regulator n=1 Tax=Nocardioides sp. GY 10127 TaxID=2569762 RepID=UPI0010A89CC5|nr:TetR/AcrR family transcriptional regulator [Nocardioides sp. GY 10127]TIC80009.1 TetR/AcrR family transcriptional regulator [Nocardioides sp. GY 10127]
MARPTSPVLSVEKIARAALALVDRTGELVVGRLARDLGVSASSLYHHLPSKAAIVEAVRAEVFRAMPRPPEGVLDGTADRAEGEAALRALLRAYRDCFAAHPRVIGLLTSHTVSAPEVLAVYDDLTATLLAAGVRESRLLDVVTVLDSFVIGSALDLAAPEEVWDAERAGHPALAAALRAAPRGRQRADLAFDAGVDLLVGGLVRG